LGKEKDIGKIFFLMEIYSVIFCDIKNNFFNEKKLRKKIGPRKMKKFSMKTPEDIQSPRGGETQQIFIGGQNS